MALIITALFFVVAFMQRTAVMGVLGMSFIEYVVVVFIGGLVIFCLFSSGDARRAQSKWQGL